ncbi:MAG: hypothetical protein JXA09_02195 [Anaerolineae bacterium]|nr:hypothetical protein [Anaerolineae bacterium]
MISPQVGRVAFRIAFTMFALSGILVLSLDPGSAEYVISVVTMALGIAFMATILVLVRLVSR